MISVEEKREMEEKTRELDKRIEEALKSRPRPVRPKAQRGMK